MNTDHDPTLMSLFAQAETELDDDAFAQGVMRLIDRQRRTAMIAWSVLVIAALACLALFAAPVVAAVNLVTQLLPNSIVNIETELLQQLVAPINSVAFVLALGILVVFRFFRRIFR